MLESKKRRSSMSPGRSQRLPNGSEYKKRKPNSSANTAAAASSSKPLSSGRAQPLPSTSDDSATLDGDSSSSSPSKGKGKAVEKDPLLELERLRKEVEHKNEILEKHESIITAITQTLTCQICFDLLERPYALAPCGHVSCYTCLVAWFTVSPGAVNPNDAFHLPGGEPAPQADQPPAAAAANAADAAEQPGNHDPPAVNEQAPPDAPQAAHAIRDSVINRRKTCPHCRCILSQRPIQVYTLNDVIDNIDPLKEQSRRNSEKDNIQNKDPWKGIFRPPKPRGSGRSAGGYSSGESDSDSSGDFEDAEVWGGLGGPHAGLLFDPGPQENNFELPVPHLWYPADMLEPPPNAYIEYPPLDLPPAFIDEEDGVRRCGQCLHELWHGECTNELCGAQYDDASDASSEAGRSRSRSPGIEAPAYDRCSEPDVEDDEEGVSWGYHTRHNEEEDADDDGGYDDGYESSFIDDEEVRGRSGRRSGHSHVGADDDPDVRVVPDEEDDFIPGPSRRWMKGRQDVVISSDEAEDDPGPSTRLRRGRGRLIVDEDEAQSEMIEGDNTLVDDAHSENSQAFHRGSPGDESAVSDPRSTNPSAVLSTASSDDDDGLYAALGHENAWDEENDLRNSEDNGGYNDISYLDADDQDIGDDEF